MAPPEEMAMFPQKTVFSEKNTGSRNFCPPFPPENSWKESLKGAIRSVKKLLGELGLSRQFREEELSQTPTFPVLVPRSYLARMEPGDRSDPLLLQVLPLEKEEQSPPPGFGADPVGDQFSKQHPGLLKKYQGRALLITTGSCAVHCRYCFRREYPYGEEPRRLADWEPTFAAIAADESLQEILLSGGDPLMLTDARLAEFVQRLDQIPHLKRLRIHTRLPIVLPDRVNEPLIEFLQSIRLQPVIVLHANHAQELQFDCAEAIQRLVAHGITVLKSSGATGRCE